ncbi:hypothetical protein ESCO_001855 [Escovopsis weberi]|uniref:Uncharacterized protein n=1 Tax=Escovopsis weberi TaxID=150374 RepID=A0A0M9VWW5_ESCWE|nr:hypothetical protein ESCO_001855 [Escovopsis weberi]
MINLILHYLLALPEGITSRTPPSETTVSAARHRKSMDLASMMAEKPDTTATPLLFNLVDLILACLRSRNQQTIYVTLQLVSAILKRHHRYAVLTLLQTDMFPSSTIHRTVGAHEQEIEYLVSLAESIGGKDDFNETYDQILKDTVVRLEGHPCFLKLISPRVSASNHRVPIVPDSLPGAPKDVREHTLRHDDPLLNSILDLMETFFLNPVETNLSVTETIVDMAICGYMSIEGWLARSPSSYTYDEKDEEADRRKASEKRQRESNEEGVDPLEQDSSALSDAGSVDTEAEKLESMAKCRLRPKWMEGSLPRIFIVLKRLTDQIAAFKKTVPRFEELLQQRREAFQTADAILENPAFGRAGTPARLGTPERASLDELIRAASPARPMGIEGFAHRLLSEFGTPSRAPTPRGRKEAKQAGNPSSGHPGNSPELLAPNAIPLVQRTPPLAYSDHGRNAAQRGLSPSSALSNGGMLPQPSLEIPAAVQAADFAAMDQSILARRVSLPAEQFRPVTLDLDKRLPEPSETQNLEDELGSLYGGDSIGDRTEFTIDPTETTETTDNVEPSSPTLDNMVSVSHVITNVLIYQAFLLELASLMQVRAGTFNEVRFV